MAGEIVDCEESLSDTTIYHNALEKIPVKEQEVVVDQEITFKVMPLEVVSTKQNRESSSSDKRIDTSDELMEIDEAVNIDFNEKFIADCVAEARRKCVHPQKEEIEHRPSTQDNNIITNAEAAKICMLGTPGKQYEALHQCRRCACSQFNGVDRFVLPPQQQHLSMVDENYMVIGMHVDAALRDKIKASQYVDFGRLLPRDKLVNLKEQKLELVHRGGQTFFVPADKDTSGIDSFHKWEQAFRIYSNIYSLEHPERAAEWIQYNHIIFTASVSYVWENVYTYDKEFHMHMSLFPDQNWAIILQQAWAMYLKDRVPKVLGTTN